MFGGSNAKSTFPVAWEENQVHYDANNTVPAAVNYIGSNTFSALNQPNKSSRDADVIGRPYRLQISLNNFCQDDVDFSASIANQNPASTGLRLSYDDDEQNSSITSPSRNMPSLPVIMSLDDNLRNEIDRQKEELDRYIRIQALVVVPLAFSSLFPIYELLERGMLRVQIEIGSLQMEEHEKWYMGTCSGEQQLAAQLGMAGAEAMGGNNIF